MAKRNKKRVYARLVSLKQLMLWQFTAIMTGLVANMLITLWHHEVTMAELGGMVKKTSVTVQVCNEISWSDCMKIRKILHENNGS